MKKRKQTIEFDECDRCGNGTLFQMNDADDGFFYDCERIFCEDCGDVGYTICDENCSVVFDWEEKEKIK